MTREAYFVLSLARGDVSAARKLLKRPLDVEAVCKLADRHQVGALCWWISRNGLGGESAAGGMDLPAPLERGFRESYLHHLLRNESLVRDLAEVEGALSARGITGLFAKGPWLMLRAYPDSGVRPVGDIDLVIREPDYRGAVEALRTIGYSPLTRLPEGSREALRCAHYGGQLRFLARGRRPLELHFRLINVGPPAPHEEWVWTSARELPVGTATLQVPGPEAMALHLLLHANQHGFAVLRLLHDIRWMLTRDRAALDLAGIVSRVDEHCLRTSAFHGLLLARDLAGATIPQVLLSRLTPALLRGPLFRLAWRTGAVRRLEAPQRQMEMESPRFYLLEMGSLREKIGYLAGLVREAGGPLGFIRRVQKLISRRQVRVSST